MSCSTVTTSVPRVSLPTLFFFSMVQVFCTHEDLHGDDLHEYGGMEFPQIYYGKYNTHPYRYFYGCGFRHLVGDSLIKMDLQGKHMKVSPSNSQLKMILDW